MYGFVNSALEKLIKRRFGVEKWEEIKVYSKLFLGDQSSFQVNHIYKDEDTYSVVQAASEILGLDAATILEMFGEQFLLSCQESGYAKTLQLLGRTLQDFLTNLDALHDHLSIIYPQMDAPSFRCTAGARKSEFLLHYYSDRPSLENIVMGIVKSVAREYYHVELEMKVMIKKGDNSDHTVFSIREMAYHRASVADKEDQYEDVKSFSNKQLISSETFCKAFPFHIVFDSRMTILQVGSSLSWVMPNLQLNKDSLTSYFALERPRMKLTFENILSHINTIFILRMIPTIVHSSSSNRLSMSVASGSDPMRLRGQMVYAAESEAMLFICSPRVKRLHDLEQRGLYLSDIPIHDATRGMLMMGQAAAAEFTKSVRLEELIIDLNSTQKSLEEEKRRMSELLHQMLPISVADNLMAGQMVEAERFESVTILFSDIVGFTSICSHSEPMQIVNMLNKLYSMFDQVVGQNQVYKVETIGDAYMVVGGLPEKNTIHAECVANQALDMMHYCKEVFRPDSNMPITMRIGIHSGPVVAGVVGRRMPRYCLFGNTVNVASRTESNGTPGKIQVTDYTYSLLKDKPNFKFEFRGEIEFKNVPEPVKCYYLLENTEKEEYTPLVLTEESDFKFILPRTPATPPGTPHEPHLNPHLSFSSHVHSSMSDLIASSEGGGCPFGGSSSSNEDHIPSFPLPDFNVIKPTPKSTPNPSPHPSPPRKLSEEEYPQSLIQIITSNYTPPVSPSNQSGHSSPELDGTECSVAPLSVPPPAVMPLIESSSEDTMSSPQHQSYDLNHSQHSTSPFMATMRNHSMSPLKEDLDEEENVPYSSLTNLDEGIEIQRKISDVSNYSMESNGGLTMGQLPGDTKTSVRRISDTSNHSGEESGIESTTSKISDASKDGLPVDRESSKNEMNADSSKGSVSFDDERRLSNSSSGSIAEEELASIRLTRAGSVHNTIKRYDSMTRQRKTGLPMVIPNKTLSSSPPHNGEPPKKEGHWNHTQQTISPSHS